MPNAARNLTGRTFQASIPVIVKRRFHANEKHWKPGEVFPWPDMPNPPRGRIVDRVERLFITRHLRHALPEEMEARGLRPYDLHPDQVPTSANDAEPQVIPEPTGDDLLKLKRPEDMTMRELKTVAKSIGVSIKRSRKDQLKAVISGLDSMREFDNS